DARAHAADAWDRAQEFAQEKLLGALLRVALGAGAVVPDVGREAVEVVLVGQLVAQRVSVGGQLGDVEVQARELHVLLAESQALELDVARSEERRVGTE